MNAKIFRLLDANANRAREALRVLEDYCRFMLDDGDVSARLKHLRHDLASATRPFLAKSILHRDTPGDVGTNIKAHGEMVRTSTNEVVIAAGKRLGEALRTMEEFCKTFDATAAQGMEKLRYRFYDIELQIHQTLKYSNRIVSVHLYVLITQSVCRRSWLETAQAVIAGGADAIQLREKDLDSGELLQRAKILSTLCKNAGVLLIINDRPDIAVLSDADGVHVGQGDLPAIEVRKIVGPEKIVGVSTHEMAQAYQARRDGADYIGVGPVFRSTTKPREWDKIPGLEFAREVAQKAELPAIAIAGINQGNLDQVLSTGIGAIALTAAITDSDDPELTTRWFKKRLDERFPVVLKV